MDRMGEDARRLWDTAQALNRRAAAVSPAAGRLPPLLFFTDPDRTPRPWETAAHLPPGAAVVFRGFGRPDAPETAQRLAEVAQDRGLVVLIGADAALADRVSAAGVHLPARLADQAARLRRQRPGWMLTAAIHDPTPDLPLDGLDALVASPVFATDSPSARRTLGREGLAAIVAWGLPTYALGGIDHQTAAGLSDSGVCGLAAVSAIRDAFAPLGPASIEGE